LTQQESLLDPLAEHPLGADEEQSLLSQIIAELNERFGTEFDDSDKVFFAELKTRVANHESIQHSASQHPRARVPAL
jgi:type I restriction enzyme R subunit